MNTIKLNTIGTPKASGGNSGGGGSASTMEYIDMTGVGDVEKLTLELFAFAVKGAAAGAKGVFTAMTYQALQGASGDITAVAINLSFRNVVMGMDETVEQSLKTAGVDVASLPRLTESEFYTL